jgi:hypothetical protein
MPLLRRLSSIVLVLSATTAALRAQDAVVRGLDHIPLAVRDLEQSQADFEALGFVLKPGRPHANGLRNAHAKFPDGTEIELITAVSASDALSSDYVDWLKQGDGPAFLSFFAPNPKALDEHLSSQNLKRVFFSGRQHSPTDRPEHFAHPNTAFALSGVWLAGAEAERRLLPLLGASPVEAPTCSPFSAATAAYSLPEANVVFLPATGQLVPGRSIVGVTVRVRSLQAVRHVLTNNRIAFEVPAGCDDRSLWVDPRAAHGMWLEFRQTSSP